MHKLLSIALILMTLCGQAVLAQGYIPGPGAGGGGVSSGTNGVTVSGTVASLTMPPFTVDATTKAVTIAPTGTGMPNLTIQKTADGDDGLLFTDGTHNLFEVTGVGNVNVFNQLTANGFVNGFGGLYAGNANQFHVDGSGNLVNGLNVTAGQTILDAGHITSSGYGGLTFNTPYTTVTPITITLPASSTANGISITQSSGGTGYPFFVTSASGSQTAIDNGGNLIVGGGLINLLHGGIIELANDLDFTSVFGRAIYTSGANGSIGSGTMSGGTCTITNSSFTANTLLQITPTSVDTHSGTLAVTSVGTGTATVTSSNALDDNTFNYKADESQ